MSSFVTTTGTHAPTREQREQMLASVRRLIETEVIRARVPERDREDVEQECHLVVWKQTEKFDPTRGTKWSTYACACARNVIRLWKSKQTADECGLMQYVGDSADLEMLEGCSSKRREDFAEETDGPIDDETATALSSAVRRALSDGLLEKLGDGCRRLVEALAFEGMTVSQYALRTGHPLKVVRANLKAALRKLAKLGLVNHVASDQEVAAVTAPQKSKAGGQKVDAGKLRRERINSQVVANLDRAAKADTFDVVFQRLRAEMRIVVASLIDRSLDVDQSVELLGGKRERVLQKLRKFVQKVGGEERDPATAEGEPALAT